MDEGGRQKTRGLLAFSEMDFGWWNGKGKKMLQ